MGHWGRAEGVAAWWKGHPDRVKRKLKDEWIFRQEVYRVAELRVQFD